MTIGELAVHEKCQAAVDDADRLQPGGGRAGGPPPARDDKRQVLVELTDCRPRVDHRQPAATRRVAADQTEDPDPRGARHPAQGSPGPRTPGGLMSPTFRAFKVRNFRLYATGAIISNVGTWMQRVAQDWLVLELTHSGTALGIVTGLQFLPALLVSPYAGLIADRFSKRKVLTITQIAMGTVALVLGTLTVTGLVADLAGLRAGLPLRHLHRFRRAHPAVVRGRDGRQGRPAQRRRPELRVLQRGPADRSRPGRPADPLVRHRSGDHHQRGQLRGGHPVAVPDATRGAVHAEARGPGQGHDPRRDALPVAPTRADDGADRGLLRRHLRPELPDDLRADGDRCVPQGRRWVRHPRVDPGDRLPGRRAARRPPGADPRSGW